MAQYYTVSSFKPSDFKDNFGNTWCDASFTEFGEPVKWVVKDPTVIKVGATVYGHIEELTSKAGKPYNRFKTDKPEETHQAAAFGESPEKQQSIYRSVALNNAALVYQGSKASAADVIKLADKFNDWLNNEVATPPPDPKRMSGEQYDDYGNADIDEYGY